MGGDIETSRVKEGWVRGVWELFPAKGHSRVGGTRGGEQEESYYQ